jgi:hypothetical protein
MFQVKYGVDHFIGIYRTDGDDDASGIYVRGTALAISPATANLAEINKLLTAATGYYLGFLEQNTTATGLTYLQQDQKLPSTDAQAGVDRVTVRQGDGKIVTDVVAGYGETGDITNAAHDSNLSIVNGVWALSSAVAAVTTVVSGRLIGTWTGPRGETGYYIEVF